MRTTQHKRLAFVVLLTTLSLFLSAQKEFKRVKHFGKNKGHLKMYMHIPPGMNPAQKAPLVVVLHGCLQCASSVAHQTGWNKLADENRFYTLYPQQRFTNNPERCFKWYKRRHFKKNHGENLSIKNMIEYMRGNYAIDSSKIFVTGLSAGAAMTVIMLADYPEIFNAGAPFAGGAYKSGVGAIGGWLAMLGWLRRTPEKLGKHVRKQNKSYTGKYPRMIIYQGNNDWVVNKQNGVEIMKQWTNLHGISQQPSERISGFLNNPDIERNAYKEPDGTEAVVFYKVKHLNHALLVDPGTCKDQGGRRGVFSRDKNFFSTLWTAYDFGLLPMPLINGKAAVNANETTTYSVPYKTGMTYNWNVPANCTYTQSSQGNSVSVTWQNQAGAINLAETDAQGCKHQYKTLWVEVK